MKFSGLISLVLCVFFVSAEQLDERAVAGLYTGCVKPKTVALTFDDGPYIYHKELSAKLVQSGVKGTFFVNGDNYDCIYSEESVSNLKASFAAGHEIASHTWAHADLATLSRAQVDAEMSKVDTALKRILGVEPALMRPPYGSYNDIVLQAAAARGQSVVMWDFDSGDSAGLSAQQSINDYKKLITQKPASVMTLNHETYRTTVQQVIPAIIALYKNAGYKFVKVSECLGVPAYKSVGAAGKRDGSWTC